MSRDYLITLFKVYFMLLANKYATILCVLKLSSKFTLFRSPQFMYIFLSIIQLQEKPDISHKLASTIIQKIAITTSGLRSVRSIKEQQRCLFQLV